MQKNMSALLFGSAVLLAATTVRAANLLNQISASPSGLPSNSAFPSQNFGAPNASFSTIVIDDFTAAAGQTHLTEFDAAVLGFGGFTSSSYSAITGWHVEIFSSAAAAATSLTGNIASADFTPAGVTLTKPYTTDAFSALVSIPLNITLPSTGTYFIGLIADLPFGNSAVELGIYGGPNLGTPGGNNAIQTNPGGGFGFTGNQSASASDAAYRLTADGGTSPAAVPLPQAAPSALVLLAALGAVKILRRKRTSYA